MDKTDSTLIDAPLLDEVVGTGPELGDITQVKAEDAPDLGDLSSVEEPPILEADEAIPVLSELITPAAPQAAPQEVTSGLAEPESGLRSFLDSSLETAANQEAEEATPAEPISNALDELLGDLPGEEDAAEAPAPIIEEAVVSTPEVAAPSEAMEASTDEREPETEIPPSGPETGAAAEAPAQEAVATDDDPLGSALDALLGDQDDIQDQAAQGQEKPSDVVTAFAEEAALAASAAQESITPPPAEAHSAQSDDETPLDLLGAGAVAAGAAALPALRARLQEHLTHRVDDILSETVAVLVQELESQIVERVEGVLMEALEAALPKLMDGFVEGLREELQPRLRAQIPALMEDILGREDAGEKNA